MIKDKTVADVMWKEVDIIDSKLTITQALETMQHKRTKMLIVDKSNPEDEYGVVLIADIASKVIAENKSCDRVNVYEIMNKPIISVTSSMSVKNCSTLLTRFGLSRCPVIDHGEVIGVVSLTNIVLNGLRL